MEMNDLQALEAYFGDYLDYYKDEARTMMGKHDWDVIAHHMDDEIREELHREYAPCTEEFFLLAYMARHTEKHGEDFTI